MQKYANLGRCINLQFKKEKLNGFSMIRTAVQKLQNREENLRLSERKSSCFPTWFKS
jgi:hypothetical protein